MIVARSEQMAVNPEPSPGEISCSDVIFVRLTTHKYHKAMQKDLRSNLRLLRLCRQYIQTILRGMLCSRAHSIALPLLLSDGSIQRHTYH